MRSRYSILRWCLVLAVVALPLVLVPAGYAGPAQPPDAAPVRQAMQRLIDHLDSPSYAHAVSWDEHVVLAYRLAQGRDPTALEFFVLRALRDQIGFTRSAALSVALRGSAAAPTWAQCRDLVQRVGPHNLKADESVTQSAQRLAAVPLWQIAQALKETAPAPPVQPAVALPDTDPELAGVRYNFYFGYLHAHSELSDGTGTALEAYTYARDVGDLDFFALTDHGEFLMLWPWSDGWQKVLDAAQATYQPGSFASLWGFEWSNPLLGHINVVNSADFTDAISSFSLTSLYDWLVARPEAFGLFNHPGAYDLFGTEFSHLDPYTPAARQMVGIETWNGNDNLDVYYYAGSWDNSYSYWDVGNRKGWVLGAEGGQDNHSADWGTMNSYRTAVLAQDLTREQIIAAYKARRFYATEDSDLVLDLRCAGYPMGSRLPGAPRQFKVTACDRSGDAFQEVRLYRNGSLLQTQAVSGTCFQATFSDTGFTAPAYYYVIVRLAVDHDGNGRNDEAISSPIWIR
jgi:hypothetical protein